MNTYNFIFKQKLKFILSRNFCNLCMENYKLVFITSSKTHKFVENVSLIYLIVCKYHTFINIVVVFSKSKAHKSTLM